jgi:signal transduction histidine kinase
VATLEVSKVFSQLSPDQLQSLRGIARERSFSSGQEIFKEGDSGDGIYVVKKGIVEISGMLADNARHVFSQVGPGDLFGEMAVLEDKPRSASAIAREETCVHFFAREDMLKLIESSPAFSLVLLREISSRLRDFNRQYLREVIQTERLAVIGRFARSIVHDLKNPLNIIGLTAELAGAEHATLQTRQLAQGRIRKQVDRISDMIGEILDFTQGGQSAVVLTPADYGEFVQQLLQELRPEVELKSVSLELAGPLPASRLLLDPKRLRRVFYNLVHNATDVMPRGGKVLIRVQADKEEVVTEIEDTGPGIPPEIEGQLFEAFVTHGKAHGTGLGLSICKKIVDDHRGWITARNANGRGAIFSFGLPLSKA